MIVRRRWCGSVRIGDAGVDAAVRRDVGVLLEFLLALISLVLGLVSGMLRLGGVAITGSDTESSPNTLLETIYAGYTHRIDRLPVVPAQRHGHAHRRISGRAGKSVR